MSEKTVMSPAAIGQAIAPVFPGLPGVELVETMPERVVGRLRVRPELCTAGRLRGARGRIIS